MKKIEDTIFDLFFNLHMAERVSNQQALADFSQARRVVDIFDETIEHLYYHRNIIMAKMMRRYKVFTVEHHGEQELFGNVTVAQYAGKHHMCYIDKFFLRYLQDIPKSLEYKLALGFVLNLDYAYLPLNHHATGIGVDIVPTNMSTLEARDLINKEASKFLHATHCQTFVHVSLNKTRLHYALKRANCLAVAESYEANGSVAPFKKLR